MQKFLLIVIVILSAIVGIPLEAKSVGEITKVIKVSEATLEEQIAFWEGNSPGVVLQFEEGDYAPMEQLFAGYVSYTGVAKKPFYLINYKGKFWYSEDLTNWKRFNWKNYQYFLLTP